MADKRGTIKPIHAILILTSLIASKIQVAQCKTRNVNAATTTKSAFCALHHFAGFV